MSESLDRLYYKPLEAVVSAAEHGKTVRSVLERQLGVSRKLLSQVKLTEHGLTVNEKRVYTTAPVSEGDVIRVRMLREESDDILPQPIPIEVVFEDEHLLIVNKPAGMIVHPTHGHYTDTMANGVVYHWRRQGERVRFRPVHRLDEETSGLVAVAKTSYVHQQLSEQMQASEVLKLYRAYVYGAPDPAAGTVDAPIDRDPDRPHVRIVTPAGYPSVTHYETAKRFVSADGELAAAVRLKLETGRTHQIRVHMRHIGCPLIGDKMYGPEEGAVAAWEEAAGRQALHAETLGFTHPITRERMEWHAPLPPELVRLEGALSS
ncbi:RluA family pseudouridine synthase [Paenibacillus arenilitoris]|uniref:Pseudouridine synthase n=1 Tax=Paenibacillus arenilitoris TaxID=2772299 RepID=A0A927CI88_9BACL|nr:RluA family pseudouridine synthase [Paenibacillus arenilitoris]MBD2867552.1 RluA family pseudouridine synthase [Paenibacillus arenilitoris]